MNRAAMRSKRERLLDFPRDPFLAVDEELEAVAQRGRRGDLVGERADLVGGRAAGGANQLLELASSRAFVILRGEQKLP